MTTLIDPYELVARALECDRSSLDENTGLGKHPSWDSFGHLNVMMAIEESYGIPIDDTSIERFQKMSEIEGAYRELARGAG
jgi:acyl carrier protein